MENHFYTVIELNEGAWTEIFSDVKAYDLTTLKARDRPGRGAAQEGFKRFLLIMWFNRLFTLSERRWRRTFKILDSILMALFTLFLILSLPMDKL